MKVVLDLTQEERQLLLNCTSDLGTKDVDCLRLRLKIAEAILIEEAKANLPREFPKEKMVESCTITEEAS
jgi:hypothetical protein